MKKLIFILLTILFPLFIPSCSNENNPAEFIEEPISLTPLPQKEWTYLFYDDADFAYAYEPLNDFSELVSSDSNINYIVLQDRNNSKASYYQVGKNHEKTLLHALGEINMGSANTLKDFLSFGKKYFPAKRYIVAFYDHGAGWMGACWDITSKNDNLTVPEISEAFDNFGKVDIALFTAPCLMASLEATYQLRNSVEYYVGSEDLSMFVFWKGMLDKFDNFVKGNPKISTDELAQEIINLHEENKNAFGYGVYISMSAIQLSKVSEFVLSFNNIAEYYKENLSKFENFTSQNIKRYVSEYADLSGLMGELQRNETDENVKIMLNNTIARLNECVVAECHGDSSYDSNGLNIYFPTSIINSDVYFSPYGDGLAFKADCSWDDLISSVLNKSSFESQPEYLKEIFALDGNGLKRCK